jgi:hypothetical protein
MVDPATLPDVLPSPSQNKEEGERKIELSEIIGLPDFDVCPYLLLSFFTSSSIYLSLLGMSEMSRL